MRKEQKVLLHRGIYKPSATVGEAVFMITGMTIGAGILALPHAISKAGLLPGVAYIAALGFIMLFLNLMIGEIAAKTKEPFQLSGLAGKYLGSWAKYLLSAIIIFSSFGTLLVYIIGEGATLSAIFGGAPIIWSIVFWSLGSFVVWGGLQRVRSVDKIFGIAVMSIIAGLSFYILPKFNPVVLTQIDTGNLFFPIGVILFALNATGAISEAHALLPDREKDFRKAVIWGTSIPIILYILFTVAVVGFTGANTTEIATIGLGERLGPMVGFFANIFAVFAMTTGFIGLGTALRETLSWDLKIPEKGSVFLVVAVPIALFLLGIRSFIGVLDVIGTFSISLEALLMAWVYIRARRGFDVIPARYFSPAHPFLMSFPVIVFFGALFLVSFYRFFIK